VPSAYVERAVQDACRYEIRRSKPGNDRLDGTILSLVKLADVLELPLCNNGDLNRGLSTTSVADVNHFPVLILALPDKRIAMQVDEVLAEEEVLVKGLGSQLRRVRAQHRRRYYSGYWHGGAVLNVADLMSQRCVRAQRS